MTLVKYLAICYDVFFIAARIQNDFCSYISITAENPAYTFEIRWKTTIKYTRTVFFLFFFVFVGVWSCRWSVKNLSHASHFKQIGVRFVETPRLVRLVLSLDFKRKIGGSMEERRCPI